MQSTTGNPILTGSCAKCGCQTYAGLTHACISTLLPNVVSNAQHTIERLVDDNRRLEDENRRLKNDIATAMRIMAQADESRRQERGSWW